MSPEHVHNGDSKLPVCAFQIYIFARAIVDKFSFKLIQPLHSVITQPGLLAEAANYILPVFEVITPKVRVLGLQKEYFWTGKGNFLRKRYAHYYAIFYGSLFYIYSESYALAGYGMSSYVYFTSALLNITFLFKLLEFNYSLKILDVKSLFLLCVRLKFRLS